MKPWPEAMRSRCSLLMVTADPFAVLGADDLSAGPVSVTYRPHKTTLSAVRRGADMWAISCNMSPPLLFPRLPPRCQPPMHASAPALPTFDATGGGAALRDFIARHRRLFVLTGA